MSNPDTPQSPDAPQGGDYTPPQPGSYDAPPPGAYGTPPPAGGYGTPTGQPGYPAPGAAGQAPVTESDERTWATLAHIGGIIIGFLAGLIVYLIYKDRSAYLRRQGAEALNFQLTILIGYVVSYILMLAIIGFLTIVAVIALQIIFGIIAGLAANKHQDYRYPFAIRFVK